MPSSLPNIAQSPLAPVPPSYVMATDEQRTIPMDFTPLLDEDEAETITSATTTLVNKSVARGEVVSIPNPTVASPIVNQVLAGSKLTPGCVYWLRFNAATNLGNNWTQILTITCPT